MSNIVYKGDVGTIISLDTGITLTGATATSIECLKPSGITQSWLATIGASNTSIEHSIASGELDEVGKYTLQAKVTISGAGTWRGESVQITVKDLFK